MTHHILEKLFGSAPRVKIMKLFLFNSSVIFDKKEVEQKTKVTSAAATKELKLLNEIGLIRKRVFNKVVESKKTGKISKKKTSGFVLNDNFGFLRHLKNLLINNEPLQQADISRRIGRAGKIKVIVISGVFIQADDSRLDILIVGDNIKDRSLKNTISTMESEIGKELRYTVFDTEDFKYRYSVCDRLIRDVLDYPHEVVVDRLGLS